jgi:hypothetical protein
LLTDQDEMSNLYTGPSIDASFQVLVHFAERFQRRKSKCKKLTDDGCQVMAKAHIVFGQVSQKVQKKHFSYKHRPLFNIAKYFFSLHLPCQFFF